MAAAMAGKQIGDLMKEGMTPKEYLRFGTTKEEVFETLESLS